MSRRTQKRRGLLRGLPAGLALLIAATATPAAAPQGLPPPSSAPLCQGCHGALGEGMPAAGIPRIAGQSAAYLDKQLRDYASGTRANVVMANWAKQLNAAQRSELAAYFASLSPPYVVPPVAPHAATPAAQQLARGHQLSHQGDETQRVQACAGCHGPDGAGVPLAAPYLAGQSAQYLTAALKSWPQGTRKNDAGHLMAAVAGRLNDADIAAVSAYFESLASSAD